jgi:hypothetical protein
LPKVSAESFGIPTPPAQWRVLVAWMGGFAMHAATDNEGAVLVAPERLVAETRADFRTAALAHLEDLGAERGAMIIDMQNTV